MSTNVSTETAGIPAKKGNRMVLLSAGLSVLLVGGGLGVFLAPQFINPSPAKANERAEKAAKSGEDEADEDSFAESQAESSSSDADLGNPPLSVEWPPLVVDVRDGGGEPHHVKLVVTIECADENAQKTVKALSHRARAKVLEYIRGQTFEELTEGANFPKIQANLTRLIKSTTGKSVKGVWITDFVAQ